jgi:transposase
MKRARDTKILPGSAAEIKLFCGFDWARHDHYFVLKNASHEVLDEGYFPNSPGGFADFLARLDAHRGGRPVALIIEATRGGATSVLATVEWIKLYPANPSKTRKLIELDGSGKGKNDRRDSHLLCDYLIANHHKLRTENESDEDILCLRELVLTEDEYIAGQTRLKNRIRAQISHFCPGLEAMLGDKLDTKAYTQYLLSFDPRQPADADEVAGHLRKHHVRSEKVIGEFLEKHCGLGVLPLGKKLLAVHCEKLRGLVRQLHAIQAELETCQGEITTYFNELPNAEIYRSLPGLGERLAPRMAAFFGKDPSRNFASKQQAAAYFGQSPVTESTGGYDRAGGEKKNRQPAKEHVKKRNSCNRRARHTAYLWSRAIGCLKEVNAPWQRGYLGRLKGQGDKAATRYRKLGKKMIAVLYTCLLNGQPYSLEVYQKNSHTQ